jgi:hypothetical protein
MSLDFDSQLNLMRLKTFCVDGDKYTAQQNKDHLEDYPDQIIDAFCEAFIAEEGDDDLILITHVEPYVTKANIKGKKLSDIIDWKYPEE